MEAEFTSKVVGGDIHQTYSDYHLSREQAIHALSKTYLYTDAKVWFDMHLDVEIGIQVRGRSERTMGAHTRTIEPGGVWFCGIFERHGYRVLEQPCEVAVLIASPTLLADLVLPEMPNCNWLEIFSMPPQARPQTNDAQRPIVLELAWRIQRSLALEDPPGCLLRRLALIELLLLFMPETGTRPTHAAHVLEGPAGIAPAVELALQSRRLVGLDEAAAACGLSRHQFRRMFQAALGLPFTKFALRHRLQGAADDLAFTSKPSKAIAAAWGFTDESHLNHAFVREYGCGPRAYRAERRPHPQA